jgi:hypothetical protein
MNAQMSPNEELDQLLSGLLDGSPDSSRNERLCELLRAHPALQNDYLDLVQLHALLIWREGIVIPQTDIPQTQRATPQLVVSHNASEESSEQFETASVNPITGRKPPSRRRWARVAALACAAAGIAFLLYFMIGMPANHERENGPEVVEQLVGWNLDIAQAETRPERQSIYDTRADNMKGLMTTAKLSLEDRDLAQTLVDNGAWLAGNDDPMAEAERFGEIADKLLVRLDSATSANDNRVVARFADTYRRVNEIGVSVNLERAIAKTPHDPKHKPKIDHLIAGDDGRAKKLEEMLERHPDASWKALNRALKGHRRKNNFGAKQGN